MFWIIAAAILLIILIALIIIGNFFLRLACDRDFSYSLPQKDEEVKEENQLTTYAQVINESIKKFDAFPYDTMSIKSHDGLTLYARYLPVEGSKKTMILCHGYRSSRNDFTSVWEFLRDEGYNLLVIDERCHGKSEGKYITFGIKERFDVAAWAKFADETYHPDSIFLHGISMGAATVMMAAELDLPKSVKGIIADCGYTSPWDQFIHILNFNFSLPPFPILHVCSIMAKLKLDFDFKGASSLTALKNTKLPVLFIHGTSDNFVPTDMSKKSFEACKTPKKLVLINGAQHGLSYLVDKLTCQKALKEFLARYT